MRGRQRFIVTVPLSESAIGKFQSQLTQFHALNPYNTDSTGPYVPYGGAAAIWRSSSGNPSATPGVYQTETTDANPVARELQYCSDWYLTPGNDHLWMELKLPDQPPRTGYALHTDGVTPLHCMHDHHPFRGHPVYEVVSYSPSTGGFAYNKSVVTCSYECMAGWLVRNRRDKVAFARSLLHFHMMHHRDPASPLKFGEIHLTPAPDHRYLKAYGGSMSLEEFRDPKHTSDCAFSLLPIRHMLEEKPLVEKRRRKVVLHNIPDSGSPTGGGGGSTVWTEKRGSGPLPHHLDPANPQGPNGDNVVEDFFSKPW
jgi:hypothetical protein